MLILIKKTFEKSQVNQTFTKIVDLAIKILRDRISDKFINGLISKNFFLKKVFRYY